LMRDGCRTTDESDRHHAVAAEAGRKHAGRWLAYRGARTEHRSFAYHPLVEERYPVLASAIMAGASQQLAQYGIDGGNLLQRTRCHYFYEHSDALQQTRVRAAAAPPWTATIACTRSLAAVMPASRRRIRPTCAWRSRLLEAKVHVSGASGDRVIAFADFHRLPADTPRSATTNLNAGEIIIAVELPPKGSHHKLHVPENSRPASRIALASSFAVAVGLELLIGDTSKEGRLRRSGVSRKHRPGRDPQAEAALRGSACQCHDVRLARRICCLLRDAKGYATQHPSRSISRAADRRAAPQHKPRAARHSRSPPENRLSTAMAPYNRYFHIFASTRREGHRRRKICRPSSTCWILLMAAS